MTVLPTGFLSLFADVTIKATALLALTAIIAVLSRRASAAHRHLIWALGLGCVLCLPLLSQTLPPWHVPVRVGLTRPQPMAKNAPEIVPPAPVTEAASDTPVIPPGSTSTPPEAMSAPFAPTTARVTTPHAVVSSTVSPPGLHFPWSALAFSIWAAGVCVILLRLMAAWICLRRVAESSIPIRAAPITDVLTSALNAMPIRRPVALRLAASGQASVPLTWRAFRPVIILPADARSWPEGRLRAALLHELAHVRRFDWALQVMAQFACAVYWFHPLAWWAARQMRAESETACDDLVLTTGMAATDYARHLLDVALAARDRRQMSAAVAMAQTPKIEGRLRTVLAAGLRRGSVGRRRALGALTASLLVALPLAALRVGAKTYGPLPAAPAAAGLQLHDGFTLRYAATITDSETTQAQFHEYQQLRADYTALLKKDPYHQPVPAEYYAPFSYYQSLRPKTRHVLLTISAQNSHLTWRQEEGGHSLTLDYNGKDGTQWLGDGRDGRVEPGLEFYNMEACPLPALGLPYVPLIKGATLAAASGTHQTWQGQFPQENEQIKQGKVVFSDGIAHAAFDGGTWKILDLDSSDQQWQYLHHRRFQGLWLASEMRLTEYKSDALPAVMSQIASQEEFLRFCDTHRTPTSVCDFHLISASEDPGGGVLPGAPKTSDEAPTAQDLQSYPIQQALHLRFHLQGWADSHKPLLQQMAQAQPGDLPALISVYQSLQALPFPLWQGDPRSNHVWDGDPRAGHAGRQPSFAVAYPTQLTLTHLRASDEAVGRRLREDFASDKDMRIAESINTGRTHVILWASGRITRSTLTDQFQGHGKPIKTEETQTEIVPAFFGADGTSHMARDVSEAVVGSSPAPSAETQPGETAAALGKVAALPNGATVRLLGVADTQAIGPTRWWAADGSPVTESLPQNTLHYPGLPTGVQGRAVAVTTSYNVTTQPEAAWAIPPPVSGLYTRAGSDQDLYYTKPSSTWWVEPNEHQDLNHCQLQESRHGSQAAQLTVLAASSKTSDKAVTVRYAVAAGPWTETVTCKKTPGKVYVSTPSGQVIFTLIPNPHHLTDPKAVARGNARFMVSDHFHTHSPLRADNPLQVALHDGENYERAVYALDRSGRIVADLRGGQLTWPDAADSRLIKTMQDTSIPNSLLKRVASFRLVARPFQWSEFRDVPLQSHG